MKWRSIAERKRRKEGDKNYQGQLEIISDVELTGFYQHVPLLKGSPCLAVSWWDCVAIQNQIGHKMKFFKGHSGLLHLLLSVCQNFKQQHWWGFQALVMPPRAGLTTFVPNWWYVYGDGRRIRHLCRKTWQPGRPPKNTLVLHTWRTSSDQSARSNTDISESIIKQLKRIRTQIPICKHLFQNLNGTAISWRDELGAAHNILYRTVFAFRL